ncbi:MAG TPA: LysM domain-containing protein [Syntrophobacteria bacterium]|nr:LysM domain-containing protein [Syntrophobacteria bacterium]
MNLTFRTVVIAALAGLLLIWTLPGCAGTQEKAEAPPPAKEVQPPPAEAKPPEPVAAAKPEQPKEPPYLVHTVKWPGETLALIAKWYTGDTENWRAIAKANPKLNPRRIRLGSQIEIPAELLKTREPMPREFVTGGGAKPKPTPAVTP